MLLVLLTSPVLAQKPLTDFVPASTMMALSAKTRQILSRPGMELMPTELIEVFGQKELGVDLMKMEEVLFLLDPPTDMEMNEPPGFGLLIRFSEPQKLGGRLAGELKKMTFLGKPGYQVEEVQILKFDEQTFCVSASRPFMSKMLGARRSDSKIKKELVSMGAKDDISFQMVLEPVRGIIKSQLPPADQVPMMFRRYLKLVDLIDGFAYRAGAENERLEIHCKDEAAAKEIVKMLGDGLDMAKHAGLSWLAYESGIADEDYQDAIIKYSERLMKLIKQGLADSQRGARLIFDVNGDMVGSVGTIGVLVGMLLPAVQQVREAARRTDSMNRIRQMGLAALNYESAFLNFPQQANYSKDGQPLLSWRVHILPYLDQMALYDQFHLDEPWDSDHNKKLIPLMPQIYVNPNLELAPGKTVYLGVAGENCFFSKKKRGSDQIPDGTSNTAMIVEANEEMAQTWTKPADWELQLENPLSGLGGLRPAGFIVLFADGSVRTVPQTVDPKDWKAACTVNGGETNRIN